MTAAPYMKLFIADYLGDTQHLTTEQHGAYLLLLMTMWRAGGSLPNDPVKLARIARVHPRRWSTVSADVMDFFTVDGELIRQKRLSEEIEKVVSISGVRRASGKAGARAKSLKDNEPASANAQQTPKQTGGDTRARHSQISDTEEDTPLRGGRAPRGTRLPVDWLLPLDDEAWALAKGLTRERVQATATKFKNYWIAKPGKDATKIDWSRTWQNWVLSDLERKPNGTGPPQKPPTGSAKLTALMDTPLGETYARSRAEADPQTLVRAIRDK